MNKKNQVVSRYIETLVRAIPDAKPYFVNSEGRLAGAGAGKAHELIGRVVVEYF